MKFASDRPLRQTPEAAARKLNRVRDACVAPSGC
jgi:hypothetical protein